MTNNTIKVPFKVSARTAKLIGLENFSTEEGAVIELVKNTYDADAKNCIIIFDLKKKKVKEKNEKEEEFEVEKFDKENSSIYIFDNGVGMNDKIIQNQWMTIGTDNKLYEHTTEGGRVKTGAKGIGRFALNRLGMLTSMTSLPNLLEVIDEENSEIEKESEESLKTRLIENITNASFDWTVDWKDFDKKGATVSDVEAVLSAKENLNLKQEFLKRFSSYPKIKEVLEQIDFKSGTAIEITELNDEWNEEKLRKLFGNLEMLLPPEEQNDFNIDLFLLNNLQEFGNVKRAYYDDYDYRINASYCQDNDKTLRVKIYRNELDLDALEKKYSEVFEFDLMKKSPYRLEDFKNEKIELNIPIEKLTSDEVDKDLLERIGRFDFTFYFLKNTISDDKDDGDLKKYPYNSINSANRKSWLKKFGGIKIFRDDFRIRPYGENGDDWLRLGERQAQSPGGAGQRLGGYRIRPNQIAGTIKISRLHNASFQDKSGREGLIENDEFELFKNIIREIISLFERDRNVIMYNLSELHKIKNEEAEKLRQGKEEAERIRKQKEQREQEKANSESKSGENNSSEEKKQYSENEENMAEAIFILEKENDKKDDEIRLLRSLASVGLIVSSFAHELHNLKNRLVPRTKFLEEEMQKYIDKDIFIDKSKYENPYYMLDLIKKEDLKLQHWLVYSLNTLKRDKRERKNVNLNKYFEDFKSIWQNSLTDRKITFEFKEDATDQCIIRAFEIDLDCIFNNLLSNSLNALKGVSDGEKKISISCQNVNDNIEILFSDNGKGLDNKYKDNPEQIFDLFESSKVDQYGNVIGTGLGLSMVQTIISEYNNSTIKIIESTKGLSFKITFKLRK
ncbi:ATP-binding protein [Sphingobacterium multivorum]|uniref:ATP-binding protein n=1 Tax=Sphingobacterium multivorum TaxID=28454 RepID=UPI003DA554AF